MANQVIFDSTIAGLAGGATGTEAHGETVRDALFQVSRNFPSMRLFNCEGELRSVIKIKRNGQPVDLAEPLGAGDTITLSLGR